MVSGCRETIRRVEHYQNGAKKKEWTVQKEESGEYVKHGNYRLWYKNGQIKSTAPYKRGLKHGKEKKWFKNGKIQYEGEYQQGHLVEERQWDEQSRTVAHRTFRIVTKYFDSIPVTSQPQKIRERYSVLIGKEVKHGSYRVWHVNGQVVVSTDYFFGKNHGYYREWFPNGEQKIEGKFFHGQREGVWRSWYQNGKPQSQIVFKKNQKNGLFRGWHPNGVLKEKYNVKQDTLYGKYCLWYPDGQLKEKKYYKAGVLNGPFTTWYANGQVRRECHWTKGATQGVVKEWYPDGSIRALTTFKNGEKHGRMQSWYDNGIKFINAHYHQGKLHGSYSWWTKAGKPISEILYENGNSMSNTLEERIKSMLDIKSERVPLQYRGFYWGMDTGEVKANLYRSRGLLIGETQAELKASIPFTALKDSIRVHVKFGFNKWGELWDMQFDFPEGGNSLFLEFCKVIEDDLYYELGLPRVKPSIDNLPGLLAKSREWGSFTLEKVNKPDMVIHHSVIKAEVYTFKKSDWISFSFQNNLLKEYARDYKEGYIVTGPAY
ncbi:MAG: hypothetical protein HQK83_15400 [Fibrobacteria bacterium]|nr:hypothetical protein [Fibrobacteria bacterium]